MLAQLQTQAKEAKQALEKLIDKIEDEAEDFAEDTQALWGKSKQQLNNLKQKLAETSKQLETRTDKTILQAHLAAMDASDQWQAMEKHVSHFAHAAKHKSQPTLDHAALQAHLAQMDTRDFMAKAGHKITEQYKHSREKTAETAIKSAEDIKRQCDDMFE